MEGVVGVMLNYGALGVMALSGLGAVWFILKELRAILLAVHETVKEIKEIHSQNVRDTVAHERQRSEECYKNVVGKLDGISDEIKELKHIQERCQECKR